MIKTDLVVMIRRAEEIHSEIARLGLVLDAVEKNEDCGLEDGEFVVRGWSKTYGACTFSVIVGIDGDADRSFPYLQICMIHDEDDKEESVVCFSYDAHKWHYSSLKKKNDFELSSEKFVSLLHEWVEAFKRRTTAD